MSRISVGDLAAVTASRLVAGDPCAMVEGAAVDSRLVPPGGAFVAIAGEKTDGHLYARRCLEGGAACVVCTHEPDDDLVAYAESAGKAVLVNPDAEGFLGAWASWWLGELGDVRVVAVTGSSGKTTTRQMCAAVLARKYRVHQTSGNYNSNLGMPLTILAAPRGCEVMVLEMGMNGAGEIRAMAKVARPQVGVITNCGVAHIGLLGSRAAIAAAKAELVEYMMPAAEADALGMPSGLVLQADDDFTPWIADEVCAPRGVKVYQVGAGAGSNLRAEDVSVDAAGCARGVLRGDDGMDQPFSLRLAGAHNVKNAMAAAMVGRIFGVEGEQVAAALAELAPTDTHQRVVALPRGITVIDDTYNANTDSMRLAVDVLSSMGAARRIACLGDMGELGDEAALHHALVGAYVAAKDVDLLVCVGQLSAHMADAAHLMGMSEDRVIEVQDAAAAAKVLAPLLGEGDVVLVKASHSTGLDRTVAMLSEASDVL